jgi:hypothetical protein
VTYQEKNSNFSLISVTVSAIYSPAHKVNPDENEYDSTEEYVVHVVCQNFMNHLPVIVKLKVNDKMPKTTTYLIICLIYHGPNW